MGNAPIPRAPARPNRGIRLLKGIGALALIGYACAAAAQTQAEQGRNRVEVLNADRWVFDKDVATGAQRLLGHVRLRQGGANMACDSAHLYRDDRVKAYGNVVLTQGDTLRITGDQLDFSGTAQTATITGQVRLNDPGMELATEALHYDLKAQRADYAGGARIVSRRDANTLTSGKGAYEAGPRIFTFSDSVVITGPEGVIRSDSLRYYTGSGEAKFLGPTWIILENTRMYCERGMYGTRSGKGSFTRAARMVSDGQRLTGDSLLYDRHTGQGEGWGNITLVDTINQLTATGERGMHNQTTGRSMITGRAELLLPMDADTLFLHADTLFASMDSSGKRLLAHRNVRFFKRDLQGVCDTLSYAMADSLISLRGQPFLWSGADQINGDTVHIQLSHGRAETLHVNGAAFLIAQADSTHFDQVAGSTMIGHFHAGELNRLVADGNARTVYFAKETRDSLEQVTGVNRADCSVIHVGLDSGKVSTVTFITQPSATLYPLAQAPPDELRLDGFRWNAAARPADRVDIFRQGPPAPPSGP